MRKGLSDFFRLKHDFFPKYIKTVSPVVLNMALYGIGTMLYSAVYGRTKDSSLVAAINIMTTIGSVSKIFMTGAAVAASVVIGREIGAGDKEKAYTEGKWLNKISPVIGIVCSIFFCVITPFVIRLYKISPEVKTVTLHLMAMLMVSVIFETVNHVGLVGILKSGGDSVFNFVVDTVGVWIISLPLLYLSGIVLKMDLEYVYGASLIEVVLKSFAVTYRIRQCRWARNLVGTATKESDLIESG
jgi:Na+-driven multidrug efflux pump